MSVNRQREKDTVVCIDPDVGWYSILHRAVECNFRIIVIVSPRFELGWQDIDIRADRTFFADTSCFDAVSRAFSSIVNRSVVTMVFCSRDAIITNVAKACDLYEIPFLKPTPVDNCRDKSRFRRITNENSENPVHFKLLSERQLSESPSPPLAYPFVIKPVLGHGSNLAYKVTCENDWMEAIRKILQYIQTAHLSDRWILARGFICEDWIEGEIVSIQVIASNGTFLPLFSGLGTHQRRSVCRGAGSFVPALVDPNVEQSVANLAIETCKTLQLSNGIFDFEAIWSKTDRPIPIELNPRKVGGEMIAAYNLLSSQSYEDLFIDAAKGRPISVDILRTHKCVSIRKLVASKSCSIRAEFDLGRLKAFYPKTFMYNYLFSGARMVREGDVLARVLIACDVIEDPRSFLLISSEIIQSCTNVPLEKADI